VDSCDEVYKVRSGENINAVDEYWKRKEERYESRNNKDVL